MRNKTKEKLLNGECVFGISYMEFNSVGWTTVFAHCGFDFLFIDMEHSCRSIETVGDIIWASLGAGITPIVRVPEPDRAFISRVLDAGAQGVVVPRVETIEQVNKTVKYTRFAPKGDCSISGSGRMFNLLPQKDLAKAIEEQNREILLGIEIETKAGLDRVDELLSHPEIDWAFIGPSDLSLSLGIPGQYEHPEFLKAVDTIVETATKYGYCTGMQSMNVEYSRKMMKRGVRLVICGAGISVIRKHCIEMVRQLREPL